MRRLDDGTIRAPVQVPEGLNELLAVQALLPSRDRAEMRGQIGDVAIDGRPNELAEVPAAAVRHHLDPATSLRDYDPSTLPESLRGTWHPELNDTLLAQFDEPRPHRVLDEAEIADVFAFLHTLADSPELIKGPELSVPESVPSGLPIDAWPGGPHSSR